MIELTENEAQMILNALEFNDRFAAGQACEMLASKVEAQEKTFRCLACGGKNYHYFNCSSLAVDE